MALDGPQHPGGVAHAVGLAAPGLSTHRSASRRTRRELGSPSPLRSSRAGVGCSSEDRADRDGGGAGFGGVGGLDREPDLAELLGEDEALHRRTVEGERHEQLARRCVTRLAARRGLDAAGFVRGVHVARQLHVGHEHLVEEHTGRLADGLAVRHGDAVDGHGASGLVRRRLERCGDRHPGAGREDTTDHALRVERDRGAKHACRNLDVCPGRGEVRLVDEAVLDELLTRHQRRRCDLLAERLHARDRALGLHLGVDLLDGDAVAELVRRGSRGNLVLDHEHLDDLLAGLGPLVRAVDVADDGDQADEGQDHRGAESEELA